MSTLIFKFQMLQAIFLVFCYFLNNLNMFLVYFILNHNRRNNFSDMILYSAFWVYMEVLKCSFVVSKVDEHRSAWYTVQVYCDI